MTANNPSMILVVEDDDADAEFILRSLLRESVYRDVLRARDGQEAIDLMTASAPGADPRRWPKLILLDLRLPRVNGFDVLRFLKGSEQYKSVPIVVFSSSAEEEDIARCYELGANSYIQKPIAFDSFDLVIRTIAGYWLATNLSTPPNEIRTHVHSDTA